MDSSSIYSFKKRLCQISNTPPTTTSTPKLHHHPSLPSSWLSGCLSLAAISHRVHFRRHRRPSVSPSSESLSRWWARGAGRQAGWQVGGARRSGAVTTEQNHSGASVHPPGCAFFFSGITHCHPVEWWRAVSLLWARLLAVSLSRYCARVCVQFCSVLSNFFI